MNVPLVLRKAKAVAPASHAYHLAHGLQLVLNSSGHSYLAVLYADAIAGGAAWEAILAQLTIGEIYPKPSAARRPQAAHLPRVLARRASIQSLQIWSASCATGEEPYSLAMMLRELLTEQEHWHATILATDINPL